MIFKWESQEQRLKRFMRISPKKKMEWLYQMHEFLRSVLTKKNIEVYRKLREGKP
jgi:hypothetical protein